MKIALVTDIWNPPEHPVARTLRMTHTELERLGHEVLVAEPRRVPGLRVPGRADRLALVDAAALARLLDDAAPDCLHIATAGPLGRAAAALARRRGWQFTTASLSGQVEALPQWLAWPRTWSLALLRRFHNTGCTALAPTEALADELRAHGVAAAALWPVATQLALFHPDGPRQERGTAPVFLCLTDQATLPEVQAFLDLDLPGEKWLYGRATGALSAAQRARLLRSADVVVQPGRGTDALPLVEAMACGTPVAALPLPVAAEVVGHCGAGGALHRDLKTACLIALHGSPREQVRARAERYSWATATRLFLQAQRPLQPRRPVTGLLPVRADGAGWAAGLLAGR